MDVFPRQAVGVIAMLGIVVPALGGAQAAIPAVERDALIALHNSTDGPNWTNNTGWLGPSGTECSWFGVTCNASGDTVESLLIQNNQLMGPIPPELGNLANLRSLGLLGNQLSGEIPPELGSLANLELLSLGRNQLTGEIPPELSNLANLQQLWLSVNQLIGSIPPQLGNLANLQSLLLDNNELTGPIPAELAGLANLRDLCLYRNQLTGEIPPELGNLVNMRELRLDNNELTGPIPPEVGRLINLQLLSLRSNQLTGSLPAELGSLANLQILRLDGNRFTGAIPSELAQLTNLTPGSGLNLRFNHLFTDSNSLREFLNSRQAGGDWESFQTLNRYFAQFGDGGGLFSQIVLFSLNDVSAATGQIEILGASGDGLSVDLNGETGSDPSLHPPDPGLAPWAILRRPFGAQ